MSKRSRYRIFCASTLLVVLMPYMMFKAFHSHEQSYSIPSDDYSSCFTIDGSIQPECPICHFVLSPFECLDEVRTVGVFQRSCDYVEMLASRAVGASVSLFCLRAPPVLA